LQMPYGPSAVCEQWFCDVYWKHCSTATGHVRWRACER
jgi:hypothetical protein